MKNIQCEIMILFGFGFFCLGIGFNNMVLLGFGIGVFSSYLGELLHNIIFNDGDDVKQA